MTLGERIQELRKGAGLSQEALGEKLGVTRQSISKWESDQAQPELDKLIAMSRLFDLTVGELLGVEEGSPAREELTDRELKAVAAIAEKLIPPAPAPEGPKQKKRWPRVLAACAAAALVFLFSRTADRLDQLEQRVGSIQSNVNSIDRNLSYQVSAMGDRVEEILESQNKVTADMGYEITDATADSVTFRLWAVPKTWREGMAASFTAAGGNMETLTLPGAEGEGHRYEATLTTPLVDDITLSVEFRSGEESQNQIIGREERLESGSQPWVDCHAYRLTIDKDKSGLFRLTADPSDLALVCEPGSLAGKAVKLESCILRLWRGEELLWSDAAESEDGKSDWYQTVDGIDVPFPDPKVGEPLILSAQITDSLGRQQEICLNAGSVFVQSKTVSGLTTTINSYSWNADDVEVEKYPWEP